MIGHYLLALCENAESDVLTSKMLPGEYYRGVGIGCLVGLASGHNGPGITRRPELLARDWPDGTHFPVEVRYDALCRRFSVERVNAAIRNRILSNRARRVLRDAPALQAVG